MPFKKQSDGSYRSPSGRRFTASQVRLYYATDGFKKVATSPIKHSHKKAKR